MATSVPSRGAVQNPDSLPRRSPIITTWVNGLKIAEPDTTTIDAPDYDPAAVLECLGNQSHIAFEGHDNDDLR